MSTIHKFIKSSSHEKITLKRRKIIRNSSISKDSTTSTNISRLTIQKSQSKNSSYEFKPAMPKLSLSNSIKKIVAGSCNIHTRKKILDNSATFSSTNPKIFMSPKKTLKVEFPVKPRDAMLLFPNELTSYEQAEILDYTDVYTIGNKASKITPKLDQTNFGFDDNRGDLKLFKGDHIAYRYEIISILGKGSFGQVCECYDFKRNEKVAVKIIKNKKRFHMQASIEVAILNSIRERDDCDQKPVVKMKNYFLFRKHVCITFDLWSISLYELLRSNKFQGISLSLIRKFAKQMLDGLEFLSAVEVIHCDLKPENVLLKLMNKVDIVIIDLGSATFDNEKQHTYIQSRFYRAPEIILGIPYTVAIDMWSLGCILAELCNGRPLLPGESEHDQLVLIMELFGFPPQSLLSRSTKKDIFFEGNALKDPTIKNSVLKVPGSKKLLETVNSDDQDFLDFLSRCFELDPGLRMSPKQALLHPFIKKQQAFHKGSSQSFMEPKPRPSKIKSFNIT